MTCPAGPTLGPHGPNPHMTIGKGGVCLKIVGGLFKILGGLFKTKRFPRNRGNLFVLYRVCLKVYRVCLKLNRPCILLNRRLFSVKTGSYTVLRTENIFVCWCCVGSDRAAGVSAYNYTFGSLIRSDCSQLCLYTYLYTYLYGAAQGQEQGMIIVSNQELKTSLPLLLLHGLPTASYSEQTQDFYPPLLLLLPTPSTFSRRLTVVSTRPPYCYYTASRERQFIGFIGFIHYYFTAYCGFLPAPPISTWSTRGRHSGPTTSRLMGVSYPPLLLLHGLSESLVSDFQNF